MIKLFGKRRMIGPPHRHQWMSEREERTEYGGFLRRVVFKRTRECRECGHLEVLAHWERNSNNEIMRYK